MPTLQTITGSEQRRCEIHGAAATGPHAGRLPPLLSRPPGLLDIAQRAAAILDALEQRTIHTQQAIEQLSLLVGEREQADAEREKLGLDPATFAVYWHLQSDGVKDALLVANEIMTAAAKYPNHRDNDDERRQLKSEIYRSLMTRGTDGAQMVRLGDAALRMLRN